MKKITTFALCIYLIVNSTNAFASKIGDLLMAALPYEMCIRNNISVELYTYSIKSKEQCFDAEGEIWEKIFTKCYPKLSEGLKEAGTKNVFHALENNIEKFAGFKVGLIAYSRAYFFDKLADKCNSLDE